MPRWKLWLLTNEQMYYSNKLKLFSYLSVYIDNKTVRQIRILWRVMEKDWLFSTDEYICDLRTVAVLVKNNKILVQRDINGKEYALPGGHIKIGETLEAGLIRETMEEMGVNIKCNRLLWSEECFWEWNEKQAHNIAFYYLVELCENQEIPDNGEFVSQKDNCNVVIGWMPIEELQNIIIYPQFLKKEIYNLNEPMKHFVSKG